MNVPKMIQLVMDVRYSSFISRLFSLRNRQRSSARMAQVTSGKRTASDWRRSENFAIPLASWNALGSESGRRTLGITFEFIESDSSMSFLCATRANRAAARIYQENAENTNRGSGPSLEEKRCTHPMGPKLKIRTTEALWTSFFLSKAFWRRLKLRPSSVRLRSRLSTSCMKRMFQRSRWQSRCEPRGRHWTDCSIRKIHPLRWPL